MRPLPARRRRLARAAALLGATALVATGLAATAPTQALPATPQAVAAEPAATGHNVALASAGADVTSSGTELTDRWLADKAIDGVASGDSRWSSNYSDQAWLAVHLARPTTIDHVTVKWEAACAAAYHLEVSKDGQTWQRASETIRPTCATTDTQTLSAAQASEQWSYVKMQAEERTPINNTKYGVSLYELEVWDDPQAADPPQASPGLHLVPLPVSLTDNSVTQAPFTLSAESRIVLDGATASAAHGVADILATELRASTGYPLEVVSSATPGAHDVVLRDGEVPGQTGDEAYALTTADTGAVVTATSAHGFFNGTRTLLQLLPAAAASPTALSTTWAAPAVSIADAPRYEYRAVMIDPARSFITVDEVKKIIDEVSNLKMSYVHFHVADDQGWRVEITNEGREAGDTIDYTRLTEVSGRTAMNAHDRQASQELGRTGYYTQAEFRDIVAYASSRFVTMVPEVDLPGHTNAALHAVPELNTAGSSHPGTPEEPTAPANGTGNVGYSYLDPNSEVSFTFMRHVLGQLADMTTGRFLHIGGDEPHSMLSRYGQATYNATLSRILQTVRDTGKSPIGWSEAAATTMQAGDGIQYWVGDKTTVARAVNQEGAKVVVSNGATSYIDQKYHSSTPIGLTWACSGTCDVRQYYQWDPASIIPGVGDSGILGNEAALWSETVRGGDQNEFLMWGRAAAHAEIGWTPQARRDVDDFVGRLSGIGPRWTMEGTNFYDTAQVTWEADLAATAGLSVRPGQEVTVPVGVLAAPGTVADSTTVSPDSTADADGVSASRLSPGSTVSVNWGDGTEPTTATVTTDRPRDPYYASGLYRLLGSHTYAAAGDYTLTLILGERTATTTVHVADDATNPSLPQPWDPSVTPQAQVPVTDLAVGGRYAMGVTGFAPGSYVDITVGETRLEQFRMDATGARTGQWVNAPASLVSGPQTLRFAQGDRHVDVAVNVTGGRVALENPLPAGSLTLTEADSEERTGETPPNGPATAAIDGDPSTFWHTQWQGGSPGFPHHITLGLPQGQTCRVTGFEYTGRSGNQNSRAKDYRLEVSENGQDWSVVHEGSLADTDAPQAVNLDPSQVRQAAYVRMVQLSSQAGNAFGGAAEIRVGATCSASPTPEPTPSPSPEPGPSPEPTPQPSPSPEPTPQPTPSPEPSPGPTPGPSPEPEQPAFVSAMVRLDRGTAFLGDWDGDGTKSWAVRVGSRTVFYNENAVAATPAGSVSLGRATDRAYVGDWDGDGRDTLALVRGTTAFYQTSLTSTETTSGQVPAGELVVVREGGRDVLRAK